MTKKLIPLLFVIAILFQGCKGDDGAPGIDGGTVLGTTFDLTKVNFTAANQYVVNYTFTAVSPNVKVLESDLVLVYLYKGSDILNNPVDSWRLLPQTTYETGLGSLIYNFDRTSTDFSIFLDGNVDFTKLTPAYTQNQTFRVVVIPSDFSSRKSGTVDYNDYEAVKKFYNIDESKIAKYPAK
ncbi:hypothetical protein [Dyadobacter sp. CY356]|uniref:hypothetical protein n=1 Tax=Dyadobacter sp. CY356 TaxID=2906442 RepID=UPI001F48E2D5|nr:hypothetical protein [Dyadobacter sp. CY356]MCF0056988.1 hypothetical protein [Dyadobacter sp. CY356]